MDFIHLGHQGIPALLVVALYLGIAVPGTVRTTGISSATAARQTDLKDALIQIPAGITATSAGSVFFSLVLRPERSCRRGFL